MKCFKILLFLISFIAYGQKKTLDIEKKYEKLVFKFDSLNNIKSQKALLILNKFKQSKDFNANDTLKYIFYNLRVLFI